MCNWPCHDWAIAHAEESDPLIQLDKEWGQAQGPEVPESLLSDDIVALESVGRIGKAQMLEAAANDDSEAGLLICIQ